MSKFTEAQIDAAWAVLHDTLGCKREHVEAALEAAAKAGVSTELVRRLNHLVSLNAPEKGGPYGGIAAEECMKAMREAAAALSALPAARVIDADAWKADPHWYDMYCIEREKNAALSAPAMPDPTPRVIEGEPVAQWHPAVMRALSEKTAQTSDTASPSAALIAERDEARKALANMRTRYHASMEMGIEESKKREVAEAERDELLAKVEGWTTWAEGLSPAEISNGQNNLANRLKSAEAENAALKALLDEAERETGWRLVPVEPTEAMLWKGWQNHHPLHALAGLRNSYQAMLAAAPSPEQEPHS